jgi:hypothetical protein
MECSLQFPADFDVDDIDHDGQGSGLVFWFAGQHPGSTRCHDSSSYGNHGLLTNMDPPTDWVWGHHGMALDFDGSNDFVSLGALNVGLLTASFWVNMPSIAFTTRYMFGGKYDNSTNRRSWFIGPGSTTSNFCQFAVSSDGTNFKSVVLDGIAVDDGKWHNWVMTWDGTTIGAYRDGIPVVLTDVSSSGTPSGNLNSNIADTRIGAVVLQSNSPSYFPGQIADVRICDIVLTDSEVWDIYSNPTGIILPRRRASRPNVVTGGFTIVAGAGSYSIAGTDASLKFGRLVSAASGAMVLTGSDINALFGRRIAAETEAFVITGSDINPEFGRKISLASGVFTISGKPASLLWSGSGALRKKYMMLLRRSLWR